MDQSGRLYFQSGFRFHTNTKGKFKWIYDCQTSNFRNPVPSQNSLQLGGTPVAYNFDVCTSRILSKIAAEL